VARCQLRYGKARRYGARVGVAEQVRFGQTRGGTGHRIDLLLADGSVLSLWPDGDAEISGSGWFNPDEYARVNLLKRFVQWKARGYIAR